MPAPRLHDVQRASLVKRMIFCLSYTSAKTSQQRLFSLVLVSLASRGHQKAEFDI